MVNFAECVPFERSRRAVGGSGKHVGKIVKCSFWACQTPGCKKGPGNPLKLLGSDTGQAFRHLDTCNPVLSKKLRAESKHSPFMTDEDGEEYELYSFEELLPRHVRFVQKCFRGFDHFILILH